MSAGVPEQLPGGAGGAAVGVVAGGGRGARQRAERVRQLHQAGAAPAPGRAARARARELRLAPRAAARPRPHGAAQPLRRPARRGTLPIPYLTLPYCFRPVWVARARLIVLLYGTDLYKMK